jgi:ribose transport system substrate-binding protein
MYPTQETTMSQVDPRHCEFRERRSGLKRWIVSAAALAVLAAVATSTSGAASAKTQKATAKCGDLAFKAPKDPDGALKGLPASVTAGYNNYAPVSKSVYANFKPKKKAPWTIGYSDSFSGNAWRAAALSRLKIDVAAYTKAGLVKKLVYTNSNLNNSLQIQQMRSMIQQKVDIILSIPGSPTAMNGVIKQAYDAGIPVLTLLAPVTSKYAINVDVSNFLIGARMAQGLATVLKGKGDIITVDGLAGAPGSIGIHDGGYAVFKNCPDIKIVGNYSGDWNNATAKTNTLKFLATHPGKIDAIWEQGSMALGIMQALKQVNRPLVTVTDGNPDKASLAIWRDNLGKGYQGVASANVPQSDMDAMFRVGMRVLQGQGLKINAVVKNPPLTIGQKGLNQWVQKSWTDSTPGVAEAPNGTWMNDAFLDKLFANPKATTPKTMGSCPCKSPS